MDGEHHKYYKHAKFCKNPRGGLKFSNVDHEMTGI